MSRFRMYPTPTQQVALQEECRHARYVWNLTLEQWSMWTRDKGPTPDFAEQCRQLTEAREAFGWVQLRLSRVVPDAGSYRVTRDRTGRWNLAFAAIPEPIPAPGTGEVVGVDRGVTVSAALSTGELLSCPGPKPDPERPGRYLPNRRCAKAGLNRGILANGWSALVNRLEHKAAGRVEKVNPAYTS